MHDGMLIRKSREGLGKRKGEQLVRGGGYRSGEGGGDTVLGERVHFIPAQ
eukprot:COSAG05_NODE_52_length_23775_cov_49.471110_17_plen_50_part_00